MMAFFEGVTSICCALVMYRSLKSVLKSWFVASKSKSACRQTVLMHEVRTVDGAYLAWIHAQSLMLQADIACWSVGKNLSVLLMPKDCVKDMQAVQCVSPFTSTGVLKAAPSCPN